MVLQLFQQVYLVLSIKQMGDTERLVACETTRMNGQMFKFITLCLSTCTVFFFLQFPSERRNTGTYMSFTWALVCYK